MCNWDIILFINVLAFSDKACIFEFVLTSH